MPRRIRELIGSALALTALFAILAIADPRVRHQIRGTASTVLDSRWEPPAVALDGVALNTGWRAYSDNIYLAAFIVAGVVLVCLMLRT